MDYPLKKSIEITRGSTGIVLLVQFLVVISHSSPSLWKIVSSDETWKRDLTLEGCFSLMRLFPLEGISMKNLMVFFRDISENNALER